jgi:hypothetical protein
MNHCSLGTALAALFLLIAPGCRAQQAPESGPLTLTLEVETTVLVPFEPVCATLTLRNVSAQPVAVPSRLSGRLEFYRAVGKEAFGFCGHGEAVGKDSAQPYLLPSGGTRVMRETLFLFRTRDGGSDAFVFDRRGTYRIKAQLRLNEGALESAPVSVSVRGAAPVDTALANVLTTPAAARMIQGWDLTETGATALERIAVRFPQTRAADHARYTLGAYYHSKYFATSDGPATLANAAFQQFAAVSRRSDLHTESLLRQTELVCASQELRRQANISRLLHDLEAQMPVVETMGQGEMARDLSQKLRKLSGRIRNVP